MDDELSIAPRRPVNGAPKGFRKYMGLEVKLQALLLHGPVIASDGSRITELDKIQWDHCPPIMQREYSASLKDTIPAANDPAYIIPRAAPDHHTKTNKIDKPAIAKTKRLSKEQIAFRNKILAKTEPEKDFQKHMEVTKPKRKIMSRKFYTAKKKRNRLD